MPCGAIDSAECLLDPEIACYACEGHANITSMSTGFCCGAETYHMHTAQVAAVRVQRQSLTSCPCATTAGLLVALQCSCNMQCLQNIAAYKSL